MPETTGHVDETAVLSSLCGMTLNGLHAMNGKSSSAPSDTLSWKPSSSKKMRAKTPDCARESRKPSERKKPGEDRRQTRPAWRRGTTAAPDAGRAISRSASDVEVGSRCRGRLPQRAVTVGKVCRLVVKPGRSPQVAPGARPLDRPSRAGGENPIAHRVLCGTTRQPSLSGIHPRSLPW